jgi:peptidoglycan/xylan/chitin deacetylase (PgdA/CDA1 family)
MAKRIINLAVSLFVAAWDTVREITRRLVGVSAPSRCVVLVYHSVTPKQKTRFAAQMDTLLRHAKPVSADIENLPLTGENFAAVSFDDGLESVVDNALPELERRHIPVTLFIVPGILGGYGNWENLGGADASKEKAMSEPQLRQLGLSGVTIGSHSMNHRFLPSLDQDQLEQELVQSRQKLEAVTGREIRLFSFPYGAFNDLVVDACRKAGYERVFTALPVRAFVQPREFVTGRVGANATDWPIEFRLKLAGAYRWLPQAYSLKRSLLSALRSPATITAKTGEKLA